MALVIAAVVAVPHVLALGITLGVLAGVYFLLLSAVGSALNGIFHGALYQYAVKGAVPDGFDRSTLARAFRRK